jgi:microcystin-dependent protein
MADPFIGEIRAFGFTYAPNGWLYCFGQRASIQEYQALYAVIGSYYGPSDNKTYFTLPDLRGRAALHIGGTSVSVPALGVALNLGQAFGQESVNLNASNVPAHNHSFTLYRPPTTGTPSNTVAISTESSPASTFVHPISGTAPINPDTNFAPEMLGSYGGSQPHENRQPYLPLLYCICCDGLFPVRPQS